MDSTGITILSDLGFFPLSSIFIFFLCIFEMVCAVVSLSIQKTQDRIGQGTELKYQDFDDGSQ